MPPQEGHQRPPRKPRWLQSAVVAGVGLLPAAALGIAALRDGLGANPVEAITHETGEWALRFLLLSLAVTPLRLLLRRPQLARQRRTLGLLAFGYACAHFSIYALLDLELDPTLLLDDVIERPYITAGFSALVLLTPLALTSTRAARRRLGRRWVVLHRLVYPAVVCAAIHFLWVVKADAREAWAYAGVGILLLFLRLPAVRRRLQLS